MNHRYHSLQPTMPFTDSVRRKTLTAVLLVGAAFVLFAVNGYAGLQAESPAVVGYGTVDSNGTVRVPALAIPLSSYMSEEARHAFIREQKGMAETRAESGGYKTFINAPIDQQRQRVDDGFRPQVERTKAAYPVNIKEQEIAGVRTDVVEPKRGVSPRNRDRVLISLHGGGYGYSSGGLARVIEALPVAGYAKIKVVSVDYRMSPKYKWPAAIEDVIAVYQALLKQYKPENIGIYGCSTGGTLTANVVAWLQKQKLPRPGAIGIFCDGAVQDGIGEAGDSKYFATAMSGWPIPAPDKPWADVFGPETYAPYMEGTDAHDPLVAPIVSLDVLSRFPPTLLISGTRDLCLSAALYTHSRLVKAGVEADLHVWDGMWHGFYFDVDLPESKEAYEVMTKFFDKHLGQG